MFLPAHSPDALGTITIVLADDHAVVRSGAAAAARRRVDLEVVAEAGDAPAALRLRPGRSARRSSCSISTCRAADRACRRIPAVRLAPETAVVMLTMQSDPAFAREALRAGARRTSSRKPPTRISCEAVRRRRRRDYLPARGAPNRGAPSASAAAA